MLAPPDAFDSLPVRTCVTTASRISSHRVVRMEYVMSGAAGNKEEKPDKEEDKKP
jgi:hypothetical protein